MAGGTGTLAGINPGTENQLLSAYLLLVLGSIAATLILWRITTLIVKNIRTVSCLYSDTQKYFTLTSERATWFKKNVLYAPILSKRHNREFQLSKSVNMGTLPTRLQLVFLLGYLAMNVIFSVIFIDFSQPLATVGPVLRNRTGTLSLVNMIPLFLMAGRNNPLITLLGISFDTFNLLHRWFGRMVALEAVVHTLAWAIPKASEIGWGATFQDLFNTPYLKWGFVAVCSFVVITIQAASIFRHAFYEIFKLAHIALAILAVAGLWYHFSLDQLDQIVYLYPVIALWIFDRVARMVRLGYNNIGAGGTQTLVEALAGGSCRVTVTMARPWAFKPGQHAYLYMPSISYWQSHPFSVAWSDEAGDLEAEKLPMDRHDIVAMRKSTMSFVIRGRTGFTGNLYKKAAACPDGKMITNCLVEGPYGGMHQMDSYGTVMLFAGGVGITQAVPHVRKLVTGYAENTVATRKIVLVWIVQSPDHLEWIRPWMTEILAMDKRRDCLRIMLFVSRPRSTKEIHSPSATVQMFPGRPNVDTLLGMEMENQVGTLGVSVCGPGALSDEVRQAVRNRQHHGSIDFMEEAFSW